VSGADGPDRHGDDLGGRAAALRRAFDGGFAELPPTHDASDVLDLLEVRVRGQAYAIPLAAVGGLFRGRRVVAFPSPVPELLGLTSLRGSIVPVYDLAALLGLGAAETAEWTVLAAAAPVAFAFEALDGHVRLRERDRLASRDAAGGVDAVTVAGRTRPLVDVPALVRALEGRRHGAGPAKEG
jgi:purine-binding chemotaxis protein CheW